MAGRVPKPYVAEVRQDNGLMRYVNDGDFTMLGIGSRPVSHPADAKSDRMSIEHVGKNASNGK